MTCRGDGKTMVGGYFQMGSIGVLVEFEGGSEQLWTGIATHVTAMDPLFATADVDISADVLEKEKRNFERTNIEKRQTRSHCRKNGRR